MTQSQIKEYVRNAEAITKKATSSKEEARKLLVKWGFVTKEGKLEKEYCEE